MYDSFDRLMYKMAVELACEKVRAKFHKLRKGRIYTDEQKKHAFELIDEYGIKGTERILHVPRRTLQRWCRKHKIKVKRCPEWVYKWAERRKKRRAFWLGRGY